MIEKFGKNFTPIYLKLMPDAFVFAILLTLTTGIGAFVWLDTGPLEIIKSWYDGFFDLLEFAMQVVLLIITGFSIALSPVVKAKYRFFCSSYKIANTSLFNSNVFRCAIVFDKFWLGSYHLCFS